MIFYMSNYPSQSSLWQSGLLLPTLNILIVRYFMQVNTSLMFEGATYAKNSKVLSTNLLSNIFRVDSETEKQTIKTTTHLNRQHANSNLSRNFGTNDWMLRYKLIKSFFFTDTFSVTTKSKSSIGCSCMQIFVSD